MWHVEKAKAAVLKTGAALAFTGANHREIIIRFPNHILWLAE